MSGNRRYAPAPTPAPAPAPAPAAVDVRRDRAPRPKAVNIRLLKEDLIDVQGCGKGKSEQDARFPILWKTTNLTGQQKNQPTNFAIGDKDFEYAMTVAKRPGPFNPGEGKKGAKAVDPNKWSMLIRVPDAAMVEILRNLDSIIVKKLKEKDILADYGINTDAIDEAYKPFLIDMGSGSYAFNTNFSIVPGEFSDPVEVVIIVYKKNPVTGAIEHEVREASPHDIRAGDSVFVVGGFDSIRIDKMSAQTSKGTPKIGFKHYASRIVIRRDESEEVPDEEDEDENDDFLSSIVGEPVKLGSKRPRDADDDAEEGGATVGKR